MFDRDHPNMRFWTMKVSSSKALMIGIHCLLPCSDMSCHVKQLPNCHLIYTIVVCKLENTISAFVLQNYSLIQCLICNFFVIVFKCTSNL